MWTGYFVLEGFDFGVGILLPVLGRDRPERRAMINTIGPVWDGNEVWLLTAGGATFAAFPLWYASMFSGFYLALLLILVALIVRGVCFEFRGKVDTPRWRRGWDTAIFAGSALPALLWGVAFGNIVRGVPMNAAHVYTGNLFTLLNPYALLGGLATLTLFTLHGAIFLSLRTTGDLRPGPARRRCGSPGRRSGSRGVPGGHPGRHGRLATDVTAAVAAVALSAAVAAMPGPGGLGLRGHRAHPGAGRRHAVRRPVAGCAALDHLGRVQPHRRQRLIPALHAGVMTWVALIFIPVVLAYQGWTYWVFRKRIAARLPAPQAPSTPPSTPPSPPPATRRRRPARSPRSPRRAAVKPLDPRLLRHAAAARGYLVVTVVLGLAATGLILAQASLLARAWPARPRGPASPRWPATLGALAGRAGRPGR